MFWLIRVRRVLDALLLDAMLLDAIVAVVGIEGRARVLRLLLPVGWRALLIAVRGIHLVVVTLRRSSVLAIHPSSAVPRLQAATTTSSRADAAAEHN